MKKFGSWTEQTDTKFRTTGDSKIVTIVPPSTLTGANNDFTLPNISGTSDTLISRVSSDTGANRLQNKELSANNVRVVDNTDTTKKLAFDVSGVTTGTTRTFTVPNASGTIVIADLAQTLTNKTIDADSNTITNIENADIKAAAGIVYSKLSLANSIVNADINSAAAIAYSKLNLSGSIVNADINASAAISQSKLAALTASKAAITDASGFLTTSAATSTEVGYLSGVTSAIQTQINSKITEVMTTRGDIIVRDATNTTARLPVGTVGQVLASDGTDISWTTLPGTGDVTAASNIADNALVRGDGGAKGIQQSGIIVSDTDGLTGITTLAMSGDLAVDTNVFKVDTANNRVGINTTSPSVDFEVTGIVKISGDLTVDTTTLAVDATNNKVSVGAASLTAANTLSVSSVSTPSGQFVASIRDGSNTGLAGGLLVSSFQPRLALNDESASQYWTDARQNSNHLQFGSGLNTDLFNRTLDNILVLSASSGNVAIGTTPHATQRLHVYKPAATSEIAVKSDSAQVAGIIIDNTTDLWELYAPASSTDLRIFNGSDLFTFSSTGRLGIGVSPSFPLHIGSFNSASLVIDKDAASNSDAIYGRSYNNSNVAAAMYQLRYKGTQASPLAVASGDLVGMWGNFAWNGVDGATTTRHVSSVRGYVDGTVSGTAMPGRLSFWTTPSTSNTATERMRITSAGNVLIGTDTSRNFNAGATAPGLLYEAASGDSLTSRFTGIVYNAADAQPPVFYLAKSRGTTFGAVTAVVNNDILGAIAWNGGTGTNLRDSAYILATAKGTFSETSVPTQLDFYTTASASITPTIGLTISSAQDVSVPNGNLSVTGNATVTGSLTVDTSTFKVDATNNRVGIGTASPSYTLDVGASPANGTPVAEITNSQGTTSATTVILRLGLPGDTTPVNGARFIEFQNDVGLGLTTIGSITHASTTSVAYNTTSDKRLKTNVTPLTRGLNTVMALQPVDYTWKQSGQDDFGFIAQEVAELVPEAVRVPEDETVENWSMEYAKLVPILTRAIQELKEENDQLKARLTALENK